MRSTPTHMPVSSNVSNSGACLRDHFLLAMPSLNEGLFSHSVTYLCEHGESGAMGLVINQPLDLSVAEIFEHLKIRPSRDFSDEPVMAGGPVQLDHGFVLHRGAGKHWDASLTVTDDITLTTSRDILVAIADGSGPQEYLIALGYAGWSAGQLEEELSRNSWLTVPADSDILFATPWQRRMSAAAGALGIDMNLISAQAGHA